jgi:hypothetical protein
MDAFTLDEGDRLTRQALTDQGMQGCRQGVALLHEQVAEMGGRQTPEGIHARFEAVNARVCGCSGDAVELQVNSAQALGNGCGGGRLANTRRSAQEVNPSRHARKIPGDLYLIPIAMEATVERRLGVGAVLLIAGMFCGVSWRVLTLAVHPGGVMA